jgi:hypothetical protein
MAARALSEMPELGGPLTASYIPALVSGANAAPHPPEVSVTYGSMLNLR